MLYAKYGREPGRFGVSAFLSFLCVMAVLYSGCGKADRALSVPVFAETFVAGDGSLAEQDDSAMREGTVGQTGAVVQEGTMGKAGAAEREVIPEQICVYVCGAVREAKVVELPLGSRAEAALQAAGGFAEDADREAVNLAALLSDGQKLYFPTVAEGWSEPVGEQAEGDVININTADTARLCTLPGIGQSRAEAILAYREQNGPFGKIEDIMKVSGIKEGAFEKIKTLITVR